MSHPVDTGPCGGTSQDSSRSPLRIPVSDPRTPIVNSGRPGSRHEAAPNHRRVQARVAATSTHRSRTRRTGCGCKSATPNESIVWRNGGTSAFGAFIGLVADRVCRNHRNQGRDQRRIAPTQSVWTADRTLNNPKTDYAADGLKKATGKPGQSSANDMSGCYVILPG